MAIETESWLSRSRTLLTRLPIKSISTHRMVPFEFNPNQHYRWRKMSEQWAREKKIRIIDLKSRRVGVSAQTDAMMWCFAMAFPNMNTKVVAHLAGSAEELFRVPSDLSRAFPNFPTEDIQQKRLRFIHPEGDSLMTMATAGTPSAGRGGTLSALHLCLRGDALVYCMDGNMKAISSLRAGDSIRTHSGSIARVKFISEKPSGLRPIVRIKTWLNSDCVVLTADHKVWTLEGWKEAGRLDSNDWIGTSIRRFTNRVCHAKLPEIRDFLGRRKRGKCDGASVELGRSFGFFCGYYLAEGWVVRNGERPSGIGLSHHSSEFDYPKKACISVRDYVCSSSRKKLEGNRASTTIYGASLATWIEREFGFTDSKKIPEWVFDSNDEFAIGIVCGYFAGDGSKTFRSKQTSPMVQATSVRPRLLYQIRHILAATGLGWGGITFEKGFKDCRGWNNRDSWTLTISGDVARDVRTLIGIDTPEGRGLRNNTKKFRFGNNSLWTRVKNVAKDAADSVWDIEVDHVDHSFETVIGVVANSEAGFYPSDESFTAMISSTSKGEGSIIVIESTANGREGPGEAFSEYWDNAVAGRNGYIPIFLGWLTDPQCLRPAEEAEDAPKDDLERELMAAPFNATREQIAWMRRTKADDCRDQETKWLQDYPHTPEVAFQVSGFPAFPREELAYAESTVRDPLCRGRFLRVNGGPAFRFVEEDSGPVFVWKKPYAGKMRPDGLHYYIGADAALGTDEGDFCAYVCICGETGELACRFAERIAPEVLADQLDMCGRYYNNAMVNPELTGNLGRWALVKLRDLYKYPNIYKWKGRDDKKRGKGASTTALGFEMNQATRRLIVDAARSGIRMGLKLMPGALQIHDRALMSQISLMTVKEWRWDVVRGHDDIAVAWMIACLTREQYPPPKMRFATKNIMTENPREQLAGIPIKEEISGMIQREMMQFMRVAKTKGRRDRLIGI